MLQMLCVIRPQTLGLLLYSLLPFYLPGCLHAWVLVLTYLCETVFSLKVITVTSSSGCYCVVNGVWLFISGCLFSSSICRGDEECVDGMLLFDKHGHR